MESWVDSKMDPERINAPERDYRRTVAKGPGLEENCGELEA
jgi:hypothetical protein